MNPKPGMLTSLAVLIVSVVFAVPVAAWQSFAVLTSDFTAYGSVADVGRSAPWTAAVDVEPVGSDAVARWHDGLYFVVDRGGSNLQILDPAAEYATLAQYPLGTGRNPQDIAFAADGTAWITCYDEALLLNVDIGTGEILAEISTAIFADADGLPETGWAQVVGDRLFIVCQRLDRTNWYQPAGDSYLLVFDMSVGDWVDVDPGTPQVDPVILAGANPFARPELTADGSGLMVGTAGGFGVISDGGLEIVDLATLATGGLIIGGDLLGGDLLDFTLVAADLAYAIVSDASFITSMVVFDPAGSTAATVVAVAGGYDFADLAWDGADHIFLADQALGATGVRVFAAADGSELTTAPIPVGRKPVQIVLPLEATTGVSSSPPASGLTLAAPWPNPANPAVMIGFAAEPGAVLDVVVCDLRGRVLRRASATASASGDGSWRFDGRDDDGRPLAAGVYRALVRNGADVASRGFTLVR